MLRFEDRADARIAAVAEVYHRRFWIAYVANFALVMGNALMYRFAELVAFLGGSERAAGAIVGTGLFGVLVIRLVMGQGIDRYGTRAAWVVSTLLYIIGSASFLACHEVSWGLYLARTIFSIGVAGMFTCSIVQIQNMVPLSRRTEAIAILGTSGFLGMIAGASLGDGIFALYPLGRPRFVALFGATAALGVFYLVLVLWLMRRQLHTRPQNPPAALRLVIHCWPGAVVLVAITLGMGLGVTTVFLTRFATQLKIPGIRTFFTAYAVVALIFRLPSTRWTRTIGRHKTLLLGLLGNTLGHFLLPFVRHEWDFVLPATACGIGHALLYPAIVSLGARNFPREYRGVGTTLILGAIELGTAVSPPILGAIIDRFGFPAMFYSASAFGLAVTIYYALTAAREPDNDNDSEPEVFIDE
ncbi:MAG TPA: MFS transporter [Planctomycetaceae bacterium]|jgi:MFS family permease|nr:MFS transporter [Planctomycetaceae bacterium]